MRSPVWRLRTVAAAVALSALGAPAVADGAGVAYLDGGEVWVASLDGAQKVRLSAGEGNWETVAQSTTGFVVATRRADRALVAQTATFTIWNPDGTVKDAGPMAGKTAGDARETLPFGGLALTPDARGVIYGYSSFVSGPDSGYFILPSETRARPVGGPLAISAVHAPTLLGERVIGTPDGSTVSVQDTAGLASTNFTPWPGVALGGVEIRDIEISENARTLSLGVEFSSGTPSERIIVWPVPGLGLAPTVLPGAIIPGDTGDCFLPATGDATKSSFSPGGERLAWSDAGGVKIAGTPLVQPTTPPENLCTLSSPPIVISPTGSMPSIGGIDVPALVAARTPTGGGLAGPGTPGGTGGTGGAGGGGTGGTSPTGGTGTTGGTVQSAAPAVTFSAVSSLKLSALSGKKGSSVQVTPTVSGDATFILTVDPKSIGRKGKKPITIATGKGKLTAGTTAKVKLRANATGKRAARKLKRKKATLTVSVAGTTTSTSVTLK